MSDNPWAMPNVVMPDRDLSPVLTAEQWVVWFRTLTTPVQVIVAAEILGLQASDDLPAFVAQQPPARLDVPQELQIVTNGLREALMAIKKERSLSRQVAILTERIIAIGRWIQEAK